MKIEINEDCSICTDCLLYLVNGEEPHNEDPQHPFDGTGNNTKYFSFSLKSEETFFSHTRCDNCLRPLAGDRHNGDLIAYKTEKKEG